ncbi:MAG: hypothetical protein M3Q48_10720, partial [Actinomycetota bacterium]|nr:hypothetical protein [Actinomycetota bacterium]
LVAALGAGSRRRVGLGRAGERHFLFHVGIGFDAAVVDQVERRGGLKRWLGHGLFLGAAVGTWVAGYDRSRPHFAVRVGDEAPIDGALALCLETDPYTFLGPRPLTVEPGTGFDTGLAVLVLRDLNLATLLRAGGAALTGGSRLPELPGVELRRDLERVLVDGYRPFPHQVDGDYLGLVESLEITHRPDCLDLVVPA